MTSESAQVAAAEGSFLGRVALVLCRRIADTPGGRRMLDTVLTDDAVADWLTHRLGLRATRYSPPLDDVAPKGPISGFEDLMWLFTPTYAARGASEMLLDEAAYVYRLLGGMNEPRVAELGRLRGGSTYLFAASGAHVTSFDTDGSEALQSRRGAARRSYLEALRYALCAADLDSRVEPVTADVLVVPVEPEGYDLVYCDIPLRRTEKVATLFERWWPGVKPGGRFVFRDGREPRVPAIAAFLPALEGRSDLMFEDAPPGRFAIAVKV